MKDKIFEFLKATERPIPATEIVQHILKIQQANPEICQTILQKLLKDDLRFNYDPPGWQISPTFQSLMNNQMQIAEAEFTIAHFEVADPRSMDHRLLAVAAAKIKGGKLADRFYVVSENHRQRDETMEGASREVLIQRFTDFLGASQFVSFNGKEDLKLLKYQRWPSRCDAATEPISLKKLARKLLPQDQFRSLEEMASKFAIRMSDAEDSQTNLKILVEVTFQIFELLAELDVFTLGRLLELQTLESTFVDHPRVSQPRLSEIPSKPGVYLFRDAAGEIIYVGKSKNLKSRISSYFYRNGKAPEKVEALVSTLDDLTYEVTGSELEALMLEARLIRDLTPRMNTQIEIHERTMPYGKDSNLILVMPSKSDKHLELFFIHKEGHFDQCRARTNHSNAASLRKRINKFFFTRKRKSKNGRAWETEICTSWLNKINNQVNCIDVDASAGLDDCMRILTAFLNERFDSSGRIIHR